MDTQMQAPTVTHFLDADYHAVIAEHIAAYPMAIAMVVEPHLMGCYDAETGAPCDPVSRGYKTLADCEAYIVAWLDTAAMWEASMQEALDYEDDIEERAWIAGGCS